LYLAVSKMKAICIPQFLMKILNLLTILDKNHPLYFLLLFETSKSWYCWPFYLARGMSRMHTFASTFVVDVGTGLPPHPSTNCPGPMVSGLLDHVTLSTKGSGAPGAQYRQAYCGLPASGEKGLTLGRFR
jgi:hypothetical protein